MTVTEHVRRYAASVYPAYLLLVVIGLALPMVITDDFLNRIMVLTFFFIMFSTSWNLLAYSGQASLGHAAFLGIGGFTSTILIIHGVSSVVGVLIGALASSLVGLFLGIICVRLKEWFLGLVTFGFAIIMAAVVNESSVFIEGMNGLLGALGLSGNLDPHMLGGSLGIYSPNIVSRAHYYYLFFFAMVGTILASHVIIRSKIGFAFAAIRENQAEAGMMGVDITRYKLIAFMISTFMAGFAGALFAPYNYFINPEIFSIHNSFMPIIMTISGGIGTIGGPIIGALVINLVWEQMGLWGMSIDRLLILGFILVLEILFLPRGLMPLMKKLMNKVSGITSRDMLL
ncbi:MAG: branched-chain amino acid ABC transporter permease [Methanosarcinales archaeon]|nr:branched-chain amino acid ABC transporter permease [ANME-2 cluster archaeon]MDF1532563.1 branched-chain amino acid ABC transporter permease [ANME-2 cluster archaeon]MDW7776721.1 branched-chain amino acid ABC transporter permease [Methanosarcinales archaeon]